MEEKVGNVVYVLDAIFWFNKKSARVCTELSLNE
jgi:hypothetical protein